MSRASAAHSDANLALRRVLRNDDGIRAAVLNAIESRLQERR